MNRPSLRQWLLILLCVVLGAATVWTWWPEPPTPVNVQPRPDPSPAPPAPPAPDPPPPSEGSGLTKQELARLDRMLAAHSSIRPVKKRKALAREREPAPIKGMKRLATFRDCERCPLMIVMPTGSFSMGNSTGNAWEAPRHRVSMSERFAIGRFEITEQQWQWCVEDEYCSKNTGTGKLPVVKISRYDADDFTDWLSAKTGRRYRLPTEAEWEYAARGGTTTSRFWGPDRRGQCAYANGADRTFRRLLDRSAVVADCDDRYARRARVGSFKPNHYGLRDPAGNVWEWVQDCWNRDYRGLPADGSAHQVPRCGEFVMRGGSWRDRPEAMRSAERGHALADQRSDNLGLRVAAE